MRYFKVYKPYGMLSQFTPEAGHASLRDLGFHFPVDAYPVGRLDHDSEGLLLLTNDKSVNHLLLNPQQVHRKTYWVQVEGTPDEAALEAWRKGVVINLKGTLHHTLPATVKMIRAPALPERNPPVNHAKHPVTSWIELSITEGKKRQVRKMAAKAGHPALRLIRYAIEGITLAGMNERDVQEIDERDFFKKLRI